jgi:hypothetical protein
VLLHHHGDRVTRHHLQEDKRQESRAYDDRDELQKPAEDVSEHGDQTLGKKHSRNYIGNVTFAVNPIVARSVHGRAASRRDKCDIADLFSRSGSGGTGKYTAYVGAASASKL